MILSSIRQDEIRSTVESPQTAAPVIRRERENRGKGIRQLQEAIQCRNLKLRRLDEECARLRRKSMILDEEISQLNTRVTKMDCVELRGPGLVDPTTALEQARPSYRGYNHTLLNKGV